MSIQFFNGNIKQLQEIVEINYSIFSGMYENEPYSLNNYQKRLSNKKPIIYLVKCYDKIVGDSISFDRNGSFYIWILGVLKEYRGKGIGTKLLNLNEEYARRHNFKSVTTKVYNVSPQMQNLLVKRDYQVIKEDKSETDEKYNVKHFKLYLN